MATGKKATAPGKRALRWKALRVLSERHADEFHELIGKEYAEVGLTYERPLTAEDRAAAQVEELLAKYPSLRGRVAPAVAVSTNPLLDGGDDDDELVPDIAKEREHPLRPKGR